MKVDWRICVTASQILQSLEIISGPKVVNEETKEEMRAILKRIQSGEFAKQFMDDCRESNDGQRRT